MRPHYDPWGVNLTDIELVSEKTSDWWQFNAQSEKNFYPDGSYDYETDFRPYDETIGRFRSADLLSDEFTGINGYQFGYNNPINFNDPTGLLSMRVVTRFIFTGPLYNTIFNNFASGFLNNANKQQIDVAVAFGGGVKDAVVRNVRALTVDLPETLTGLASLTTPIGQVQAIVGANMHYENTKQDWNSGDPKKRANIIGNVVGEIGFGILSTKGAGAIGKTGAFKNIAKFVGRIEIDPTVLNSTIPKLRLKKVGGNTLANQNGRELHKLYRSNQHDPANGYHREYTGLLKKYGIKPDFVDFNNRTIYDLKPNNPKKVKAHLKQVENYKAIFEKEYGGKWATVIDHY